MLPAYIQWLFERGEKPAKVGQGHIGDLVRTMSCSTSSCHAGSRVGGGVPCNRSCIGNSLDLFVAVAMKRAEKHSPGEARIPLVAFVWSVGVAFELGSPCDELLQSGGNRVIVNAGSLKSVATALQSRIGSRKDRQRAHSSSPKDLCSRFRRHTSAM